MSISICGMKTMREKLERDMAVATKKYALKIPPDILEGLAQYVVDGRPTGDFLRAVLTNDFTGSACRADEASQEAFVDIAKFVIKEIPAACWGSAKKVDAWIDVHRAARGWE